MQPRSLATVIVLSLFTCGIYSLYWIYKTAEELEAKAGAGSFAPAILLVLVLFTGPVGYLLYGMSVAESINRIYEKKGLPVKDNKVMFMILGFVFPLILVILAQTEFNKIAEMDDDDDDI